MKFLLLVVTISLVMNAWLPAQAGEQVSSNTAAAARPKAPAGYEADYALTLRDPFSPIGYILPEELRTPEISENPLPSADLITRAISRLRPNVIKRVNMYVAYVNGTIVKVGDELSVTVEGQTVVFIVKDITLGGIKVEPKQ